MGQPVRRVLFRRTVAGPAATIIHLRTPLPTPSSGLPGHSGEQPSNVPCLALLQVGFTLPFQSPGKRWSLTPPFHPYPCKQRRSVFCGTGLRVAPSGRYPPPCSTEPGRSSGCSHNTRSSSCPIRPSSIAGCATPGIAVSPGPVCCCGRIHWQNRSVLVTFGAFDSPGNDSVRLIFSHSRQSGCNRSTSGTNFVGSGPGLSYHSVEIAPTRCVPDDVLLAH